MISVLLSPTMVLSDGVGFCLNSPQHAGKIFENALKNTQGTAINMLDVELEIDADSELDRQKLTLREAQVIELVAEGLTDKEIGSRLAISPKTVSEHVEKARNKLGAANRASAVYVFFVKLMGRHVQ
jgi:DNA-binding NarL/FixJ family response regulator